MFKPIDITNREPDIEVIEACEWLLDMAKAGRLRGVVLAAHFHDLSFATRLCGELDGLKTVGLLARLQHEMHLVIDDQPDVEEMR